MSSSHPSAGQSKESNTSDNSGDELHEERGADTASDPETSTRESDDTTASQELIVPLANLSGRRILHFHVQERLGAGAMSSVYRAVDERTGEEVALKVLLPGADGVARSRFRQEADTALQLDHPHIIRTVENGAIDDEDVERAVEVKVQPAAAETGKRQAHLGQARAHAPVTEAPSAASRSIPKM